MAIKVRPQAAKFQGTQEQFNLVAAFLKRLQDGNTKFDDIADQYGSPGVYRWCPPQSLRFVDEDTYGIRVFYAIEDEDIIILNIGYKRDIERWWYKHRNEYLRW